MDEVNFLQKIHKSKSSQADEEGSFDQAKQLYNTLASRRKSRFINRGNLPGALYLISSSRFPDDFTETKAREAEMRGGKDNRIYVFEGSQWSVKGRQRFMAEEFQVQIGNETSPSKVLKKDELPSKGCEVINVPMDFYEDFMRDVDGAIRDHAGMTTLATRPFISQRQKIHDANVLAQEYGYGNPMQLEQVELSVGLPDLPLKQFIRTDVKSWRAAHVDLGISKDACGIAVGHLAGYRVQHFKSDTGKVVPEILPVIAYDVVLRIVPPLGGEIQLEDVRKFLRKLNSRYKLGIKYVTFDGFNSVDSRQLLTKAGFQTGYLSVEKPEPWRTFRDALYTDRILLFQHHYLTKELTEVETTIHNNKEKIDHRANGTKDVADAVVGVAAFILGRRAAWNQMRFDGAKAGLFLFTDKNLKMSKAPTANDSRGPGERKSTNRRNIERRNINRR
jgi:hypothetical protein